MRSLLVAAVVLAAVALGGRASADCLADCDDAYQDAVAACQEQFGATGQEVQLQECMDAAQAKLAECNGACAMPD